MTLHIFISSRPVFLFCHNVFWKLNRSVNESRIQFPVKPRALPGLLTAELEHHNKHLLLFYLNMESMEAICHSLTEIEPKTFVSSSLLYWTVNCSHPWWKEMVVQRWDLLLFSANVEADSHVLWMESFQPNAHWWLALLVAVLCPNPALLLSLVNIWLCVLPFSTCNGCILVLGEATSRGSSVYPRLESKPYIKMCGALRDERGLKY